MKVTLEDIAATLDLSVSTVSRSLKQDERISPRTRAKVATCANQLGYRIKKSPTRDVFIYNSGTSLRKTVAVFILIGHENLASAPLAYKMVEGISHLAHRLGISLILHTVPCGKSEAIHLPKNQPPAMRDGTLDGAILIHGFKEEVLELFAKQIPSVSVAHFHKDISIGYVGVDNSAGMADIVDHLAGLGHSKIAYLTLDYKTTFSEERLSGFLLGHLRNGISFDDKLLVETPEEIDESGCEKVIEAMNAGATALVCVNDNLALKIFNRLKGAGIKIPEDISLTGFDGLKVPEGIPELTTVKVNFEDLGAEALEKLLSRIDNPGKAETKTLLPGKISIGESTSGRYEKQQEAHYEKAVS